MQYTGTSSLGKSIGVICVCLLGALGLQFFIVLIGAAVAAAVGNIFNVWHAISILFSWPIFFLSLITAIIITVKYLVKSCLISHWHCCPSHHGAQSYGSCCATDHNKADTP